MSERAGVLAFRFVLEMFLLIGYILIGTEVVAESNFNLRVVAAIVFPILAVLVWAIFRVPGEGGPPLVAVSGRVRLVIEALVFGVAIAGLIYVANTGYAWFLGVLALIYYALAYDRVLAMLRNTLPSLSGQK